VQGNENNAQRPDGVTFFGFPGDQTPPRVTGAVSTVEPGAEVGGG